MWYAYWCNYVKVFTDVFPFMLCMPFIMFILGSFPFVESCSLIKYDVCPLIVWPLILIGMKPLCLGGILRVDLPIPIVVFRFTVSSINEKSVILLYAAVLFLILGIWKGNFFWISIPNSISVSGSLLHVMKLWGILKSIILRWSAVIPNAVIGDPSAVFNLVVVACIGVLKLLSTVWYVEYLMRDMAVPKSIKA